MSFRAAVIVAVATVLLALGGIVYVQSQRLESSQRQLHETTDVLDATCRSLTELDRHNATQAVRETAVRTARGAIVSAPAKDVPPASPMLLQALRSADQIGGLK